MNDECFNIYTGEVRIVSDDVLADQGLYKTLLKPDYFYLSEQQYPLFDSEGNYAGIFHNGTFKDIDDIIEEYAN